MNTLFPLSLFSLLTPRVLSVLSHVSRVVLGMVFAISGVIKAVDIPATHMSIAAYDLAPLYWTPTLTTLLITAELLIAAGFITGTFLRTVSLGCTALLFIFITGVSLSWMRGMSIECGCFGYEPGQSNTVTPAWYYGWIITRDMFMIGMCYLIYTYPPRKISVDGLFSRVRANRK